MVPIWMLKLRSLRLIASLIASWLLIEIVSLLVLSWLHLLRVFVFLLSCHVEEIESMVKRVWSFLSVKESTADINRQGEEIGIA